MFSKSTIFDDVLSIILSFAANSIKKFPFIYWSAIDDSVGISKPVINLVAGKRNYDKIKNIAIEKTIQELPQSIKPVFPYAEEAMDLEATFRNRMQKLPPGDFVDFLRQVFREDELKLILVGAALGLGAGIGQLFLVFGY